MVAKNPAIGACPCPVPKCAASCEVKKFQNRSTRDTGHRFAGKWYLICPEHGRLGMDAKPAMQDYIGDNARMFSPEDAAPPPAPEATPPAPAPAAAAPAKAAPAPATTATPKPRTGFSDWEW